MNDAVTGFSEVLIVIGVLGAVRSLAETMPSAAESDRKEGG